ncbi:SDR family NAD(P)-dependent oxidoreductase [Paenibacillus sp. 1P07SE]|uniref:SDR family NAD(P)-dependent oxidoreductase n=1 Tax=Paenibacillus sp. 1P07SE TaxID=3132209 RepID=UPI0039A72630
MDRTVWITGAAGGIGRKLGEAYLDAGYRAVLTDLDHEGLTAWTGQLALRWGSERVLAVPADLSDPEQITELARQALDWSPHVDVLINNAGFGITKPLFELTWQEWDRVVQTNLRGAFLCAKEAAGVMRSRGEGGSIVNIASTRALMSEPDTEAYAASKGGLTALTHALAASLSPYRITVNCISPGWIETGDRSQLREQDHSQHLSGRVGHPADIARACLYLTDPGNDFVTGVNLVVDGGMTRKMIYEP